jgi:CBS domain containing-hemolysin-like protein
MSLVFMILLLIVLVILSGFFSSSEIAYALANKLRLEKAGEGGRKSAVSAFYITQHFTDFLSTILVGNSLVNIGFSSAFTLLLAAYYDGRGENMAPLLATLVLLVFGDIVPKLAGTSLADRLVYVYSYPLRFFMLLFKPVVTVIGAVVKKLSPIWTPEVIEPEVTDDELVTMVENIEEEGVFTEQESELIKSAIEFMDVTALNIFIPRVDVGAFDIDDDIDVILRDPDLMSYSRVPVYRGTIDNIIGIMSTKKLIKAAVSLPRDKINIEEMLTPPIFVHKTRNISSILMEFKKKRQQMAVVVDEFGGTMGILTLEDILEVIVGDIFDESDDVEHDMVMTDENVYNVDGSTDIYDFFDFIGYTPEKFETKYTTMGGWAIEMLDRFPKKGDCFTWDRFEVCVTEAESMRVEMLQVKLLPENEDKE